jgi:hypothetical protein
VKKLLWIVAGLVAAFFAFGFYGSSTPEGKAKSAARRAIELCWKDQERKSNDAQTQQFIAGACEKMEADFEAKFGHRP